MYIYLSSNHSTDVHSDNTPACFTVQLPETFKHPENNPRGGLWFIGIVDIVLPQPAVKTLKDHVLYVTCKQVEGCALGTSYTDILRSLPCREVKRQGFVQFSPVLYVPLRVQDVTQLTIELRDSENKILQDLHKKSENHPTLCTLELVWRTNTDH